MKTGGGLTPKVGSNVGSNLAANSAAGNPPGGGHPQAGEAGGGLTPEAGSNLAANSAAGNPLGGGHPQAGEAGGGLTPKVGSNLAANSAADNPPGGGHPQAGEAGGGLTPGMETGNTLGGLTPNSADDNQPGRPRRRQAVVIGIALLGLLMLAGVALLFGRYPKPGLMPPASLLDDPMAQNIILLIRLPRVLGAILAGAALGAAGCAFQLIFANPLVDAGFLGVSQGASFGAALAMSLGGGLLAIFGLAFGFGLLALGLAIFLASRIQFGGAVLRLVLSGIAISAFFSAAVSLIKFLADPIRQLPDISYWLMGGLSGMSWELLAIAAGPALFSVTVLLLLRWRILLLSLDEGTAASLGARPRAERLLIMGAASLGAASVSAAAGPVSWVGLIVPHVSRLLLGSDGSASLPASALTGAIFVLLCDTIARALFAGELPLGIVSALLGTAVFFALLAGRRLRVERT